MQKILIMDTENNKIRSKAISWEMEEAGLANSIYMDILFYGDIDFPQKTFEAYNNVSVEKIPCSRGNFSYATPLHALGDHWRLLSPPVKNIESGTYTWYFVKNK